jgi:hypothetical protein
MTAVTSRLRLASLAAVLGLACAAFAIQSAVATTRVHAAFPSGTFTIESVGRPGNCATDIKDGAGRIHTQTCNLATNQRWTLDSSSRLVNKSTSRCATLARIGLAVLITTNSRCLNTVAYHWNYELATQHIAGGANPHFCWRNLLANSQLVSVGSCTATDTPSKWLVTII